MRLAWLRFNVRRVMVVIAILAVPFTMFFGIPSLFAYMGHSRSEKEFREGAVIWETKNEPGHAAYSQRLADDPARLKQETLSRGISTLVILALGSICGGT
jgi:hypothetical protein